MKDPIAIGAVFVAAFGLFTVQAQPPHTPPTPAQTAEHRVAHYTTLLSLSAAQEEEATTLFTAEAASEATLRASERTEHEALDSAVKSDDSSAIQQAASTLGQLNGQLTSLHATADAKFYASLSADQKAKFEELEKGRGMRGPGERPGPPQ
jgi:Spy/CpxP family protein refolding chaperone